METVKFETRNKKELGWFQGGEDPSEGTNLVSRFGPVVGRVEEVSDFLSVSKDLPVRRRFRVCQGRRKGQRTTLRRLTA